LRIAGILGGYLFMLIVSRKFGPQVWGDFSIFLVILQIMVSVSKFGLDMAFLKVASEAWVTKNYVFLSRAYLASLSLIVPMSILVAVITLLMSEFLADSIFHKPHLIIYFYVVAFLVPFLSLLSLHSEGLRVIKRFVLHMLTQQAGVFLIAFLILLLLSFFNFFNEYIPVIAFALAIFFCLVLSLLVWFYSFWEETSISFSVDRNIVSYLISLAFPLFISGIASMLMTWTDIIMLGIFLPSSEVGVYSVALRVSTVVSIVLVATNTVLAPRFAELWALKKIDELVKFARSITRIISFVSFVIFFVIVVAGRSLLAIFGNGYISGYYPLIILAIGQLVNACSGSVGYILMMTDFQHFHRNVTLLSIVLNVFLNWLLIPKLGILGAAIATMVTMIFWNAIFSWKVKQVLGKWIFGFKGG
jgi:O-antigen/teichoic acid export membrane protein